MKKIKLLTGVLVACVYALFLVSFTMDNKEALVAEKGYEIGEEVMNFNLPNTEGKSISLSDFSNEKGVILIFTCNTCPYAVAYEDRINELHQKYSTNGYPVLAVNPNDPEVQPGDSLEEMKKRKKEKSFKFEYLLDVKQEVYPKFGATKTPHVFLLQNKEGKFYLKYIGAIDDNYKDASQVKEKFLENAVRQVENGEEVSPKETKAIGCTIKTK